MQNNERTTRTDSEFGMFTNKDFIDKERYKMFKMLMPQDWF